MDPWCRRHGSPKQGEPVVERADFVKQHEVKWVARIMSALYRRLSEDRAITGMRLLLPVELNR